MPAMAQTREGAIKIAAKKSGTTEADYVRRMEMGQKWCSTCRKWQAVAEFGKDSSRWDGLAAGCKKGRNAKAQSAYIPKTRPQPGRSFVPPRDGDEKQARHRVNYFVEMGLLPHPNTLPCVDCGHRWRPKGRRHEYDHFNGYAVADHENVEVVCSRCHHIREGRKRESNKNKLD